MIPRCGGAGTPSDGFRLEDAMNDHDADRDSTRVVRLSDDQAQLVQILGWGLQGSESTWRARLTAEQERVVAELVAWRGQWANGRGALRGLSPLRSDETPEPGTGTPPECPGATEGAA